MKNHPLRLTALFALCPFAFLADATGCSNPNAIVSLSASPTDLCDGEEFTVSWNTRGDGAVSLWYGGSEISGANENMGSARINAHGTSNVELRKAELNRSQLITAFPAGFTVRTVELVGYCSGTAPAWRSGNFLGEHQWSSRLQVANVFVIAPGGTQILVSYGGRVASVSGGSATSVFNELSLGGPWEGRIVSGLTSTQCGSTISSGPPPNIQLHVSVACR